MATSYSFHISAKGHSLKNSRSLSSAYNHNYRKFLEQRNYDRDKIIELIENPCFTAKQFKERFNQVFATEVAEYNSRQKRDERKILDYFDTVEESVQQDIGVEIIVQVADKEFWEQHKDKRELMIKVFKEQLKTFQEIVPGFVVTNATLHQDEASPHLHIVGIPKVDGFKRGLSSQCSKSKLFTRSRLVDLQDLMRANAEELMKKYLISDFKFDEKGKGRNHDYTKEEIIAIKKEKKLRESIKEELRNDAELRLEVKEELKGSVELRNEIEKTIKDDLFKDPDLKRKAVDSLTEREEIKEIAVEKIKKDVKLKQQVLEQLKRSPQLKFEVKEEMKNDKRFQSETMKALVDEWDLSENEIKEKASVIYAEDPKNKEEFLQLLKDDEYFIDEMEEKFGKELIKDSRLIRTLEDNTAEYLMQDFVEDVEDYEKTYQFISEVKKKEPTEFIRMHSMLETINFLKIQKAYDIFRELKNKIKDVLNNIKTKIGWENKKEDKEIKNQVYKNGRSF